MEIAPRIADGEYDEGEKLRARSDLAAEYGVSSETARRAALVLADLGIAEATQGSGVQVLSRTRPRSSSPQEDYSDVKQLREKLLGHFQRQRAEMDLFIFGL
jgi:DNA-binding GntR family transcriptional regulator